MMIKGINLLDKVYNIIESRFEISVLKLEKRDFF
jgi:hypothetical protein